MANRKISKHEEWERSHFNKIAREYEHKYGYDDAFTKYKINKKVSRFIESIKNNLDTKKPLKIFEIGCGTGTYTFAYSKKLPKDNITATDISEEMINLCNSQNKSKSNIKFIVKSAYNTGIKNDSVDVVSGFYVLHHIDQKKVRREILRILKPGGVVYFYEPNILNPVVFLIKSNKFIKKLVGDSSEEWAINPLKVKEEWSGFDVVYNRTTEFIWPFSFVPYKVKLAMDKFTSVVFGKIPLLNLIGGSVEICLVKK